MKTWILRFANLVMIALMPLVMDCRSQQQRNPGPSVRNLRNPVAENALADAQRRREEDEEFQRLLGDQEFANGGIPNQSIDGGILRQSDIAGVGNPTFNDRGGNLQTPGSNGNFSNQQLASAQLNQNLPQGSELPPTIPGRGVASPTHNGGNNGSNENRRRVIE
ncbi:hypothetical protein K2X33_11135 [bacterium]|nr:hypothetical protein [bacterium]